MSTQQRCLVDILALAAVYAAFLYGRWKAGGNGVLLVRTILYVYLGLVFYVTLMPVLTSLPFLFDHPYVPMHLLPFEDYLRGRGDAVRQIVLNVLMMVPFGFLLPAAFGQRFFSSALWTLLLSLGIELLQPLLNVYRSSDITDVITNTAGGVLGYLLYLPLRPLIGGILSRLDAGRPPRTME